MAIDPRAPARSETMSGASAIENEIPAYRAISGMAVFSFLLGLASLLCFIDPWFLLAGAGAMFTGFLAQRKILRYSDVLTGAGFAQAGIAMALVFGLSSLTTSQVDQYLMARSAGRFADRYAKVLEHEGLDGALWYRLTPAQQKGTSPRQNLAAMKGSGRDAAMHFQVATAEIEYVRARTSKGDHLHRVGVEACGYDGLEPSAGVLMELDGPGHSDASGATDDLLLELRGEKVGREIQWHVSEIRTNYHRRSYVLKKKVIDNGHGHTH